MAVINVGFPSNHFNDIIPNKMNNSPFPLLHGWGTGVWEVEHLHQNYNRGEWPLVLRMSDGILAGIYKYGTSEQQRIQIVSDIKKLFQQQSSGGSFNLVNPIPPVNTFLPSHLIRNKNNYIDTSHS